jgi:hypothetical protein
MNAPWNGAPPVPFTVPVIVAPEHTEPKKTIKLANARALDCERMDLLFEHDRCHRTGEQIIIRSEVLRLLKISAAVISFSEFLTVIVA